MSHYISPNLINHPPKLFCQLAGCNLPIPLEPYPPPFSLLKIASAELAPSERDIRRFFCSEEHRDQCWKTEQGWFDRRVAMPSVSRRVEMSVVLMWQERAVNGPTAWKSHPANVHGSGPSTNFHGSQHVSQYQAPWARYEPPTPASGGGGANQNHGQGMMPGHGGWVPGYGWYAQPSNAMRR
jgi:hypothetical protein